MGKNNIHQAVRKKQIEQQIIADEKRRVKEERECSIGDVRNNIQRGNEHIADLKNKIAADPENDDLKEQLKRASNVLEQNHVLLEELEDEAVEDLEESQEV